MLVMIDSIQLLQQILTKEAPEGSGDFRIVGKVIRTLSSANDLRC
jgi:hypothetical protein